MQFRSFMLFKKLSKTNGLVNLREPFSILAFDSFPTEEFEYRISLSFEEYDSSIHTIKMLLKDPEGNVIGEWPEYEFKGFPDGEARSVISGIKMRFAMAGKFFFSVSVDGKEIGEFSLIVQHKEGR